MTHGSPRRVNSIAHRDYLRRARLWNYARCRRSLKVWLSANQRRHLSLHLCRRAYQCLPPCWDFRYGQSRARSRCVQMTKEDWSHCGCLTQLRCRHCAPSTNCRNARSLAALRLAGCCLLSCSRGCPPHILGYRPHCRNCRGAQRNMSGQETSNSDSRHRHRIRDTHRRHSCHRVARCNARRLHRSRHRLRENRPRHRRGSHHRRLRRHAHHLRAARMLKARTGVLLMRLL